MSRILGILSIVAIAPGIVIAQGSEGQVERPPTQSPASRRPLKTVTPQTYPIEQIQAGGVRFSSQCGFCHGRDAAGGETGPDLTRSKLVAEDHRGDKIGPLVRTWTSRTGYAGFQPERCGFGRDRRFHPRPEDQVRSAGRRASLGGRRGPGDRRCRSRASLFQRSGRMLRVSFRYGRSGWNRLPISRDWLCCNACSIPADGPLRRARKLRCALPSGETVVAPLASEDEFTIVVLDPSGARQSYEKSSVKFQDRKPDVGALRSTRENTPTTTCTTSSPICSP